MPRGCREYLPKASIRPRPAPTSPGPGPARPVAPGPDLAGSGATGWSGQSRPGKLRRPCTVGLVHRVLDTDAVTTIHPVATKLDDLPTLITGHPGSVRAAATPCGSSGPPSSRPSLPPPGRAVTEGVQVGAYNIVAPLAAGGMCEIWVAEHTLLERCAAIKVLRSELSSRPEMVKRFFDEARIMTAIANPGIVQIFDFGFHVDGSAYLVMELLSGETLHDRIERLGAFAVADALHLVRQVANALALAHAHGIVHRD